MCGLRSLLLRVCLLVLSVSMMTPVPSQARSVWTSRGPSTPLNPSVWLPVGKTHGQAPTNGFSAAGHSTDGRPVQSPSSLPLGGAPWDQIPNHKPFHKGFAKDPSTYRPFYWDTIISMILDRVTNRMYGYNEFELLNHQCAYHTSPVLMDWHLQIMAKVWCPGWTHLKGTAITTRMARSIEFATRDFVKKAMNNGIISEDEARVWLSGSDTNYSPDVEA